MISFFEWRNCLMYIQDSVPFSEYCLLMCLGEFPILFVALSHLPNEKSLRRIFILFISVPMYVVGIIETQFFAYLQLIRYRLCLLNKILIQFDAIVKSNKHHSHYSLTVDKGTAQIMPNSFEHLVSKNNPFAFYDNFKSPTVHWMR